MAVQAGLSPRQKAAIIVRLLLDDDDDGVTLDNLNGERQALLFQEMAGMELIDRQTRDDVIAEFCDHLESVGVTFPGDLDGTLEIMSDRLSKDSSDRLRRLVMMSGNGDPWPRILELSQEDVQSLADSESIELVAVMLSKLPVEQAAKTYTAMDPERARQLAQAMAMTRDISPQALRRVGMVLAQAADALPRPAIEIKAHERMGDMLNFANADLRDNVLELLDQQDREFALDVRRAIFVFAHIPKRVEPKDVPRIVRDMNQQVLIRALSQTTPEEAAAAEFMLTNLSQRMSENLRDEIASLGSVTPQDAEAATNEVVVLIRRLAAEGELTLIPPKDD